MLKRIIAFFTKRFFGKPAASVQATEIKKHVELAKILRATYTKLSDDAASDFATIDPMLLPSFRAEPKYARTPDGPMRLKHGERVNWTNRGFYRGHHGPVVRVHA